MLASGSTYRAALAAELAAEVGAELVVVRPEVDERALDHRLDPHEPGVHAVALARAKAAAATERLVVDDRPTVVVGADQMLVADGPTGPEVLHQPGTVERAVAQLVALSGRTHRLVNGVVVHDVATGRTVAEADVHHMTMRPFTDAEARDYVERFLPLDCVGAYRIEDDADLLIEAVGEDRSGVIGLPLPTVRRLLGALGWPAPTVGPGSP